MKVTYDPFADALYFKLNNLATAGTASVSNDVLVDFSKNNIPVGFEILSVSQKIPKKELRTVTLSVLKSPKLLTK